MALCVPGWRFAQAGTSREKTFTCWTTELKSLECDLIHRFTLPFSTVFVTTFPDRLRGLCSVLCSGFSQHILSLTHQACHSHSGAKCWFLNMQYDHGVHT